VRVPDAQLVIRDAGRRVAELRARHGWTQAELAERLNIALQNMQRIEQGRQNLTIATLTRLAHVLGCAVRDFFDAPTSTATTRPGRPRVERAAAEARGLHAPKRGRKPKPVRSR
jgi:transcriptional regulator with XRE-family HTH domain